MRKGTGGAAKKEACPGIEPWHTSFQISFPKNLCFSFERNYRNKASVIGTSLFEAYSSVYQCVKRMISTHSYVVARIVDSSSLTDNDVAGLACRSAEYLYA